MNSKKPAAEVSYRLAKPGDAEILARMSRRLIENGLPWWAWTPARVRAAIRGADTVALIASDAKVVLGFALMQFGETSAHLSLLAVEPRAQRRGIGRALLAWLTESCLVAGIERITLEVRENNRDARQFYTRLGFSERGLRRHYYCGIETAVRLDKVIALSVPRPTS